MWLTILVAAMVSEVPKGWTKAGGQKRGDESPKGSQADGRGWAAMRPPQGEIDLSVDTKASIGLPVDAVFRVPARAEKMTPRGFEPRLQA